MKAYVCDACYKTVRQVIRIDANLEHAGPSIGPHSTGSISGDYCQDCANKIILFMYGLKGMEDSTEAKMFRANMNSES